MLSMKLMSGGLVLVLGFAGFYVVGCNEGNTGAAAEVDVFAAGCVGEEIAATDKGVTRIVRMVDSSGGVAGYRVEMKVVSKSGPFDIMVALDGKGCVLDAQVLKYTARRGREVRSRAFTRQ